MPHPQSNVLAIDTSQRRGGIALLKAEAAGISMLASQILPTSQRTAQVLLPELNALLASHGLQPSELDLVCVTTGPGSFTGLRVGVTVAKTLAYATGASLVGIHTLTAIAAQVATPFERLWTILDAQREELFAAQFASSPIDAEFQPPSTEVLGIEPWLQSLRPGDVVCGPPLQTLHDQLPSDVIVAPEECWSPKAESVGKLGVIRSRRSETVNPMQLVPHYFRKSAAEEKADAASET